MTEMMKKLVKQAMMIQNTVDGDVGPIFPLLKMCFALSAAEQSSTGDSAGYKNLGAGESSN